MSGALKPALKSLTSLTNGLDTGLTQSAGQICTGVDSTGAALDSVTSGIGLIAQGTCSGLGNTLKDIPKALFALVHAIDHSHSIVSELLNTLL